MATAAATIEVARAIIAPALSANGPQDVT